MTKAEYIARYDRIIRPLLTMLNSGLISFIYSNSRKFFLNILTKEIPDVDITFKENTSNILWNLKFNSPLFNAAGMFKNADGYYTSAAQGAGAYLAGTATSSLRKGNIKNLIKNPFLPYPKSGSASNWMGLPNLGHDIIAKKLSKLNKIEGCPVGISVSIDPENENKIKALINMTEALKLYEKANVDFIEINESCPNVEHKHNLDSHGLLDKNMNSRLEYISKEFLNKRTRNLPVIVKFSNDTNRKIIPDLINLLLSLNYDGINFGNTSTNYSYFEKFIDKNDLSNFRYFTTKFGGGLSGRLLKDVSLNLSSDAANYINNKTLTREFHVIRTGGIENNTDIKNSYKSGVSINQWFTGYFDNFSLYGHNLYKHIFQDFLI
jgi:dihydroorotate dehydrogenase